MVFIVVVQKTDWTNTCVQHNSWAKCDTLQGCNQYFFLGETKPMWWTKSTPNLDWVLMYLFGKCCLTGLHCCYSPAFALTVANIFRSTKILTCVRISLSYLAIDLAKHLFNLAIIWISNKLNIFTGLFWPQYIYFFQIFLKHNLWLYFCYIKCTKHSFNSNNHFR